MQAVSTTFSGAANAAARFPTAGALVSWNKQTASGINYFTIGTSTIGGRDIIKSTGIGTVAMANQYAYTTISSSGIVSWSTSFKFDQVPYGLVQRQADLVLANASGAYLPASGTSVGSNMNSSRPVIISAGFGNESIPMFTGYSDSPVNDVSNYTTTLHAYDAVTFLKSYVSMTTATQINQKADQIIANLLTEAGFATNQYVLETSLASKIAYLDPYNMFIGDIIQQLCQAEGAMFFADEDGILHFWNRQHFANNKTVAATLTYSNMRDLTIQNAPIINNVYITSTPEILASGTVNNVYSLTQPYYIQASSTSGINYIWNPSFETSTSGWQGNFSRVTADKYYGNYSASGTSMTYGQGATASGLPVRKDGYVANKGYGYIGAQFYAKIQPGVPVKAQLLLSENANPQSPNIVATQTISGSNDWSPYSISYSLSQFDTVAANPGYISVSGTTTSGFLVDAFSDNLNMFYFDGSFANTNSNSFSWSGTPNNSPSIANSKPQYLNLTLQMSQNVYSLVAPVASGLNNPSIGANQSFYSFSTASGVGGIFGSDATSNITLLSYSNYGNQVKFVFRNNTTTQAYLTNMQLYGTTAQYQNQIVQQYSDATSMTNYGVNPFNNGLQLQISNNYIQSASDALALAEYLVFTYRNPLLRVTTNVFSQPQLQFGDLVSLVNTDTSETRQMFVVGIDNVMDKDGAFNQKLTLQERNISSYFTIGTSKIGGTDQIAP